jgi:hypothetical protein
MVLQGSYSLSATAKLASLPRITARIEPGDILTPEQLAERLQVAVSWVYEKSRVRGSEHNPLPVLRCGRYLRFSWPDVCEWLRSDNNP